MIRPEWKLCGAAYAILAGVALSGCVNNNPSAFEFATAKARNTELALSSLIALDTAQTVTIAHGQKMMVGWIDLLTSDWITINPSATAKTEGDQP